MAVKKNFHIESFDVDAFGTVRPSALMQRMQQLAGEDLEQYGTGYSAMRAHGQVFVLFATKLHLSSPLRTNDDYRLESYSVGTHGATFTRDFYFFQKDEQVAVASTKWVLLDFEKRKILPPSRLEASLEHFPEMACSLTVPKRLPVSDAETVDQRTVYPSMLDENRHLNNCVYADLATDYLPQEEGSFVSDVEILFTHEAALWDRLEIQSLSLSPEQSRIHAHNLTRDLPCFTAQITRSPLS